MRTTKNTRKAVTTRRVAQGNCPGAIAPGQLPQGNCPGAIAPRQLPWGNCPGCSSFSSEFIFHIIFKGFQIAEVFFNWKTTTSHFFDVLEPRTCQKLTFYAPGIPRGADRDARGGRGAPRAPFRHPNRTLTHPIGH